jgi:hypothetical protein
MKKIMILVVFVAAIGITLILLKSNKDNRIGQNGQLVKPGNPSEPIPTSSEKQEDGREIEVYLPAAGAKTVGVKFVIYGKGRAFENTLNYRICDDSGKQLYLGSFMTNAPDAGIFGYFHQEIELTKLLKTVPHVIRFDVFEASAKDGSDIHKTSFELDIDQSETAVFAYFSNNNLDPEVSCNKTFAVARLVPKTQSVLKAAMEELLKGPASAEAKLGFGSSINSGVALNSIKISGNKATIDFSKKIEENAAGSCRVSAIRNQITNTARQFSNIKNVIISVDGQTEAILQP